MGRTHAGTWVILLVQDLQTRVINAATGELLRRPDPRTQPRLPAHRSPEGTQLQNPEMNNTRTCIRRSGCRRFLRHHSCSGDSVLVQDMSNTCL
jgi:hypothetical protein